MLQENQRNLIDEHRLAFSQLDTHFDEIQHLVALDENVFFFNTADSALMGNGH